MDKITAWKNDYGSVMRLAQAPSGAVWGVYSSSTGSTGQYRVLGYADPAPPEDWGQSMALSVYWRSMAGGTGDPSWHWVSGLSGQTVARDGIPTLILMHAMVATTDFPGLATAGTYSDKLVYTPDEGGAPLPPRPEPPESIPDSLGGVWICEQRPDTVITLSSCDAASGAVAGRLTVGDVQYPLQGFSDVDAAQDDLPLQGLALAAAIPAGLRSGASCLALAGSLNRRERRLSLLAMTSQGTQWATRYLATTTAGLAFRPAGPCTLP